MNTCKVSPADTKHLDSQMVLTFVGEDGSNAIFIPKNSQDFIDLLVEMDEATTQFLFDKEQESITEDEELLSFLKETILGYIDADIEESDNNILYYTKLKTFLESNSINSLSIELLDDDASFESEDEDQLVDECLEEFSDIFSNQNIISLNESINNLIDEMSVIEEVVYKKVVRGGVIKKLLDCPPGFKSVKGRCVRMGSTEVRKRAKASIKANKTKAREMHNTAFVHALNKRRAKSLKLRHNRGLK
jgi:hypothetical protein